MKLYSPVSVPEPVLNVGEPVGAETNDVESEALTDAADAVENDVGKELKAEVLLIEPEDATEDSTEDGMMDADDAVENDREEGEAADDADESDGVEDERADTDTGADDVGRGDTGTDDATEDGAAELSEVSTELRLGVAPGSFDTTLLRLLAGALEGAASTRAASWMRPYATRRPGESFIVSDASDGRNYSASPLFIWDADTNGRARSAEKQMEENSPSE